MKPKIICIIPISKESKFNHEKIDGKELFQFTFEAAVDSKLIDKIVVCSDDLKIKQKIKGDKIFFLERPDELSHSDITGEDIVRYAIEEMQKRLGKFEITVYLEITHPFRKKGLIDQMINVFLKEELDTLFIAYEDKSAYWKVDGNNYKRVDEQYTRTKFRSPVYKELKGLGSVTYTKNILEKNFFGERIGIIPVRDLLSLVDIKTDDDLWLARALYRKKVTGKKRNEKNK